MRLPESPTLTRSRRLAAAPALLLGLTLAAGPAAAHEYTIVSGDARVEGGEQVCFTLGPIGAETVRLLVRTRFSSRIPAGYVEIDGARGPAFRSSAEEFSFVVRPEGVHRLALRLDEPATLDRLILDNRDGHVADTDCARYEADQRRRVQDAPREEEERVDRFERPGDRSDGRIAWPDEPTDDIDDARDTRDTRDTAPTEGIVPEGTELELRMERTISSESAYSGQRFETELLTDVRDRYGDTLIPAGTTVVGRVAEVENAGRYGRSKLRLAFEQAQLPDGRRLDLNASLRRLGEGSGKKQGAIIAGSAAGGALLGQILGGDTEASVLGALIGGGIAAGTIGAKKGEPVIVPAGAVLGLLLEEDLRVPAYERRDRTDDDWDWERRRSSDRY